MGLVPPCLICGQVVGVKTEISDEVLEAAVHNHCEQLLRVEANVEVENGSFLLHYFYKLFQLEPERNWNFGNEQLFCPLCRQKLELLMELQRKLEELNEKLDAGKGELKKVLETSEESWRREGVYEKDQRYLRIRRQILGHIKGNSPVPTASHQPTEIKEKGTSRSRRSNRSCNTRKIADPTEVAFDSDIKINPFVLLSATDRKYAEIQKGKKEPPSFEDRLLPDRESEHEDNFPPSAWTSSDSDFGDVGVAEDINKNFDVSHSDSDPDYEVKPKTKTKLKVVKNRLRTIKNKNKSSGHKPTNSNELVVTPGRGRPKKRTTKVEHENISKYNQLQEEADNLESGPEPKRKGRIPSENKDDEEDPDFMPAEGQDDDNTSSSEDIEDDDEDEEFDLDSFKKRLKSRFHPSTGNYTLANITLEKLPEDESGKELYKCQHCSKLVAKKNLREHVLKVHKNHINKPKPRCKVDKAGNYTFLNITAEKLANDEFGRQRFHCTKCFETIIMFRSQHSQQTDQRIKAHVYLKHSDKFKCDQCDARFASNTGRHKHVQRAHENRLVLCTICEKPFTQTQAMRRHRRSHLNEEERQALNQRKRTKTSKAQPKIQCEECGQIFPNAYKLQKHHQAKHIAEDERAKCLELCSQCGRHVRDLKSHNENVHNTFRSFPCLKCDKRFKNAQSLRKHKNAVHENIREFKCDLCPKAFVERRLLETHKNVHLNIRQFQCEHCPSAFTRMYHLQRHVGVYHDGVPKRPIFVRGPKKRGFEVGSEHEHKDLPKVGWGNEDCCDVDATSAS